MYDTAHSGLCYSRSVSAGIPLRGMEAGRKQTAAATPTVVSHVSAVLCSQIFVWMCSQREKGKERGHVLMFIAGF